MSTTPVHTRIAKLLKNDSVKISTSNLQQTSEYDKVRLYCSKCNTDFYASLYILTRPRTGIYENCAEIVMDCQAYHAWSTLSPTWRTIRIFEYKYRMRFDDTFPVASMSMTGYNRELNIAYIHCGDPKIRYWLWNDKRIIDFYSGNSADYNYIVNIAKKVIKQYYDSGGKVKIYLLGPELRTSAQIAEYLGVVIKEDFKTWTFESKTPDVVGERSHSL